MVSWKPTSSMAEESNVYRYMVEHNIKDLRGFVRHTYEEPERFWSEFARIINLRFSRPYKKVLDLSRGKPWASWFVGAGFNLGSMIPDGGHIYLRWMNERGDYREATYSEILSQARSVASFLRRVLDLSKGDRVAVYMPMIPEIVPIMLGVIRAGLIFVPLFSGFGPEPIRVRVEDCDCRVVFASDVMYRRGKEVRMLENLEGLNVIKVVVNRSGAERGDYCYYDDVLKTPGDYVEDTDAEDPAMLLYTSGTTGKPKACVHSHIGFAIKAAADMYFQFDVKHGETLTWITDMGWMMGPWAVLGTLLLGSRMAIYEGYPDLDRIVEFVREARVEILGLSASLVRSYKREKPSPPRIEVKAAGNTGEPIDPDSWVWLYRAIGEGPIINYSGGTEISGGILGNYVISEIRPSSFNAPSPGIDARVLTEDCREAPPNTEGELAVKSVWPGMTRGFWKDPERYIKTYWSRCSDTWIHGDLAIYDSHGFFYIVGRSDDTIKVAGKRIGPAEIESAINSHPSIAESACIGVPHEIKGETIYCFAIRREEVSEEELIEFVSKHLGRALTPERILFVKDLPRTRNAKIMRRMIKAIMMDKDPGDTSALENPYALEEIRRVKEALRKARNI